MKINLSSPTGDPRNPKVWSGTAANFLRAVEDVNGLEAAFESRLPDFGFALINKLITFFYHKILGRKHDWFLSWILQRYLKAYASYKLTASSDSNHTLHFTAMGLPFRTKPKGQFHYLYIDGTWNSWSKYGTNLGHLSSAESKRIEDLEARAYAQVEHIFTTSEYVKANLEQYYKINSGKITVVGTGTGVIQPYFGAKNYNNGKILFVAKGRFEDKGGSLVIESFKRALLRNSELQLSIVGQSSYLNIEWHPRITTYGFIPIEELQDLFNTHSLFLMPAINEPWGLVYLEAMLCKMPIVGLNRNSFPELSGYGERGVGVDSPDVDQLSEVIVDLFKNTGKMQEMGLSGQNFVLENLTWKIAVETVLATIGNVDEG